MFFFLTSFPIFHFLSFSQTTLPTGWGFNGSPPNGWTISGTDVYTSSGYYIVSPGCKFDNTSDYVEIFFSDAPGPLTYFLRGSSFSGGVFSVQESVNGSNWSNLRVFTNPPASMTEYADTPSYSTRYIRFFYTQKSGGNIAVDEVNLALAPLSNEAEMSVKQANTPIASGGTFPFNSPVGVNTQITFVVENLGMQDTLFLNAPVISGANASEFNVVSFPSFVPKLSSGNIILDFLPQQAGTRYATLSMGNNDTDENPYTINLFGVGGSLATEPVAQPYNLIFSNIKSFRFKWQFSPSSPSPDGYIVLRKTGSPVTEAPTDGKIYLKGDTVGNAQVASIGSGTSYYPNNIVASTAYYFAVFSFNGMGPYRNYLQTNPLSGNKTSSGNMMGNYYSGIDVNNPNFITALHNKIYPHYQIYYSNYINTNINLFSSRDTSGGQKVVTCAYSGYNYVYSEPFDWATMSREHTYCHSWMPSFPADNPELKEYDDQHHLFPTEFNNANSTRSNFPLGEVVNVTSQFMDCKLGKDVNGRTVFEPRDEHKGDAARALMYMAVSYNGLNGNNWKFKNPISGTIPYGQDQDVIKKWHFQDPPDNWEIARNDFLDSLQGNRNPFVDSIYFACYIDFLTMTKIDNPPVSCTSVGLNEINFQEDEISVFPNPSNGRFSIKSSKFRIQKLELFNILGETVFRTPGTLSNETNIQVNLTEGIYFLRLDCGEKKFIRKLVLN